jgi:hypothetical protein
MMELCFNDFIFAPMTVDAMLDQAHLGLCRHPPMTLEEIQEEVNAVRAARKANKR